MKYSRGKNPNSKKKRVNSINDSFFNIPNLENCYWAGLLAADGNVSNKVIHISLQEKDKNHIYLFNDKLNSSYKVRNYIAKEKFPYYVLCFTSELIKNDLLATFSITERKSLTLKPPNIKDKELIDSFIIGYIDGDGTIGLYNSKRQKSILVTLLGTLEMCSWIKERFEEILGKSIKNLCKSKKDSKNTYRLYLTDKNARIIFKHFYNINVPKLERKWSKEIYDHCINYKKFVNKEKHLKINKMLETMSQKEISKELGISQAAISWYKKKHETKQLDKGEINIEEN